MPYCEAAVLEAVRMFMGHTFGIPHRALRDTKFRGFNIPKVSCFLNIFHLNNLHYFLKLHKKPQIENEMPKVKKNNLINYLISEYNDN